MKKQITFFLSMLFVTLTSIQMNAQTKKVLYLNNANAQQEQGTSVPGDDPVTRMLEADPNFEVTPGTIDGSGIVSPSDISQFDLIIVQETVASGNSAFIPDEGVLALKNLVVPVIYNKTEIFRDGKAITDDNAAIASVKSSVSVTVDPSNQSNSLFSGIDFSGGDDVRLFFNTANDNGTPAANKIGLKVLNDLDISPESGTLATTPQVTDPSKAIVINYFPANTQLGTDITDKASVDIVALAFGYGPIVRGDGANITSEALTIWRNAAYLLTGQAVPNTLYENTEAAKRVLYVNQTGVGQGTGASAPGADPIINMLDKDENFYVTYVETPQDGSALPPLSGFDLVIAQETMSSGAELFSPTGVLGVKNVTVPIIYNKTWAFRNGKAVTDVDAAVTATQNLSITVDPANQSNALFSGIDFTRGNNVRLFKEATANDDGSVGGNKAIDVLNDLDISPAAGTLATVPEVTDAAKAFVVNYLPSGTQLGEDNTDVLGVDAVALSFSYGASILGSGSNITPEALTIWRNAAYVLTGLTVPTTLVQNSNYVAAKNVLYVNQVGVGQGPDASAPGADPIIKMLTADPNFDVTYIETTSDGTNLPALAGFDLVIAQETLSSGASIFSPGGILGVKDVTVPIIYNKTWAFRDGRAITDADATVTATQNLSVTATNTTHPLFKGIDFTGGNEIRIFKEATANDDGSTGGNKSIDVLNNLEISNLNAGSIATTPEVIDASKAFVINYIPAGTQLGEAASDILTVNAVALSFSYGATIMGDGENISPEALTIWRNAAYMLTYGPSAVPSTLVLNPDFTLSIDKVGEVSDVSTKVRAINDRIYVSNVKSTTEVSIYSITGAIITSFKTNENTDFQFRSGIWIVTVKNNEGAKAVKLITR